MYINVKSHSTIYCLVALFMGLMGCTDDINIPNSTLTEGNAEVTFVLSEAKTSQIETRAIDDSSIADAHIVIFDRSGQFLTKGYYTSNRAKISIPPGSGYTIYAIANTGDPDYFSRSQSVFNSENDFKDFHHYYDKGESLDVNGRLIMCGSVRGVSVQTGKVQLMNLSVERIVAKINLKVTTAPGITITKYVIKELHTISYLIARPNKYEGSASDLEKGDDLYSGHFDNSEIKKRFTLDQEVVTSDMSDVTFYMLQNRAGGRISVDGSTGRSNQMYKAKYAPPTATYVEIHSTGTNYASAIHKVYLGADNSKNYNVKRNFEYIYNINIKDKQTVDTRVDRVEFPSNCYIVTKNNRVTFPVSRANEDGINRIGSDYTAELLWVDNNKGLTARGTIKSVVGNDNGTITVETGSAMGNAVVVVKDDNGEIAWSWHIWVTDYDPNSANISYDNGSKTTVFMDRNLGASANSWNSVIKSFGLLYQWGRKDPFPGADYVVGSTPIVVYDKDSRKVNFSNMSLNASMQNNLEISIKSPMTFYSSKNNQYDWFTYSGTQNDELWCGADNKKTVYDPCPVGWRVPLSGKGFASVWYKPDAGYSPTEYADYSYHYGYNFDSYEYKLGWYPATKSYDYYTGNLGYPISGGGTYMEGCYWSALPIGDKSYVFEITETRINVANTNGYRASGCAVRCVKE